MSLPWFQTRRRASALEQRSGKAHARARQLRRRVDLDALEDRMLLAGGITLSSVDWTAIGPAPIVSGQLPGGGPVSGRITGIAADPVAPNTIYIASAGGGVWKTLDGGVTWAPLTDAVTDANGNPVPEATGAVAVAQSNLPAAVGNRIIYAGTGEANNSGDSAYGEGVEVSFDGGQSWTLQTNNGVFSGLTVAKIAVDPSDATGQTVYAAFDNLGVNGTFGTTGIYKSTDAGKTWTNTTAGIATQSEYTEVAVDPTNGQTLYAAIGSAFADSNNGIYKSTNGGTSWTKLGGGAPSGNTFGRISLALAPSSPNTLYAATADPATGALKEIAATTDGGATWANVTNNAPNAFATQGWYDNVIIVDPTNPAVVFVAGSFATTNNNGNFIQGIIESTNSGGSWTDISLDAAGNGPHVDYHAAAFDAAGNLLVGSDGGIWQLSTPEDTVAQRWKDLNGNLSITQFTNAALDPSDVNVVYGGSQDNGTEKFNGALGWSLIQPGDGGFTRVSAQNPQRIYQEFFSVSLQRSDDGGNTFSFIAPPNASPNNANFYVPYVLNPANGDEILYGTDTLYESTDAGNTWSTVGTPGSSFNAADAPIDVIAVSGTGASTTIYVTAGGSVYVSRNNGTTWARRDVGAASDKFGDIAIDPTDPRTAYIVRDSFNATGNTGQVFRTTDAGQTWTNITGNLRNVPANAIALDVTALGTQLWVGTDTGVYYSSDLGSNWSAYGAGLPNVRVVSLEFNENLNVLLAGTHGRGAWEIEGRPIIAVTPNPLQPVAVEGLSQDYDSLVTFDDSGGADPLTNYLATIDWGDGTTTLGTITGSGPFTVSGSHTYADEGVETVTVTVTDSDGATTGTASESVVVADAPIFLNAPAAPLAATEGAAFSGAVAVLSDQNPGDHTDDFTAKIDWGDGRSSAGAVVYDPSSQLYSVSGSETYQHAGTYTVKVTVVDAGGQSASVTETITVADAPLTGTPVTLNSVEGATFGGTAATFTDANPFAALTDFSATINWGDGTTTPGTLKKSGVGAFGVTGVHVYAEEGTYNVNVTVNDVGGSTTTIASTMVVADAPLTPTAATVATVEGQPLAANSVVATFVDANTNAPLSDFTATIDWGNGVTSAGTIVSLGNGKFSVTGGTLYPEFGTYSVTVTIFDRGGSTASTVSKALVSDAPLTSSGVTFQGVEGQPLATTTVAIFNDTDIFSKSSDFTATIDWGDGTTDAGSIVSLSGGTYGVTGSHTYAEAQPYAVTVLVDDIGGQATTAFGTAQIADAPLAAAPPAVLTPTVGQPYSGAVATFTDPNPFALASSFITSIDWGDGVTTPGVVTPTGTSAGGGPVTFTVSSSVPHAYKQVTPPGRPGVPLRITVTDLGGSTLATTAVANVANAPMTTSGASPVQVVEGATYSGPVARFTDGNIYAQPSDFRATIDWGDGHVSFGSVALDTSAATTTSVGGTTPAPPAFVVSGLNTFAEEGQYAINVTITDSVGQAGPTATTQANVADAPLRSGVGFAISAVAGASFSGPVASFADSYTGAPVADFTATINWGDGSPVVLGNGTISQPGGPGTPFVVSGIHTYANAAASIPVAVTVNDAGGSAIAIGAGAHVQVALTGGVNASSVNGAVSRTVQPQFSGQAEPGATVQLMANGANVGVTTATPQGTWSITSRALADGTYGFTAEVLGANNSTVVQSVPVSSPLVVDTTGPSVVGVSLDAVGQTLHVTLRDTGSGLNMAGANYAGNFQLQLPAGRGLATFRSTGLTVTPGAPGSGEVTVNVSYALGRRVRPGGYVVTVMGNYITDLAGNSLVERTFVTFPQTTNAPNPNYVAQINVGRNLASSPPQVYIPLAERNAANRFASRVHLRPNRRGR
jgi:photosystem II stability/assembly factor-like uncharacterized protein/PKD repeat protein